MEQSVTTFVFCVLIAAVIALILYKLPQKINMPVTQPVPQAQKITTKTINAIDWDGIHCDLLHPTWPKEHAGDLWLIIEGMPDIGNSPQDKILQTFIRDMITYAVRTAKTIEFQGLSRPVTQKPGKFGYVATVLVNGQNIMSFFPSIKNIQVQRPLMQQQIIQQPRTPINGQEYHGQSEHFRNPIRIERHDHHETY
jgi:hypothetical protein